MPPMSSGLASIVRLICSKLRFSGINTPIEQCNSYESAKKVSLLNLLTNQHEYIDILIELILS